MGRKKRLLVKVLLFLFPVLLLASLFYWLKIFRFALGAKIIYTAAALDFFLLCYLRLAKSIAKRAKRVPGPGGKTYTPIGYKIALLLTYFVPIAILAYVVYMNWLPFGFEKTYVLDVGAVGDTDSSQELYLIVNKTLSKPQQAANQTFRVLNGKAFIVFKPKAVLKNATVTVKLGGKNVFLENTQNFNPDDQNWDLSINMSKAPDFLVEKLTKEDIISKAYDYYLQKRKGRILFELSKSIAPSLIGNVSVKNKAAYFDGYSFLEYKGLSDLTREKVFAAYLEFTPINNLSDSQFLIGQDNWALLQNRGNLTVVVGDLSNASARFYKVSFGTKPDFFRQKHRALIIYTPKSLELFVDNISAGKAKVGSFPQAANASNVSLRLGLGSANDSVHYRGYINRFAVAEGMDYLDYKTISQWQKPSWDTECGFAGNHVLYYPNTSDKFETGPISLYVEWTPKKNGTRMEIVGHYNWELFQDAKAVSFQVGRMENVSGKVYSVTYNTGDDFFGKRHSALLVYQSGGDGYIMMYVDGQLADLEPMHETDIWTKFGTSDLSVGLSGLKRSGYFEGCIHTIQIANRNVQPVNLQRSLLASTQELVVPIIGRGNVSSVELAVKQE